MLQLKEISTKELEEKIEQADVAYFEKDSPTISDEEYDHLKSELATRDPLHPLLARVGLGRIDGQGTYKHDKKMLSLDKGYTQEEIEKWSTKIKGRVVATPKLDGLALSLKYKNRMLVLSVTRGDGEFGEDVTDSIFEILSIPKKIPVSRDIEIRGEAYLPFSAFEWIRENLPGKFENPRNLAAGAIKSKKISGKRNDFSEETKKVLSLIKFEAYDVVNSHVDSYWETLMTLQKAGFLIPNPFSMGLPAGVQLWQELDQDREKYDKPVDGVVFRADSYHEFEDHGYTSHHPKGAIAFKFSAEIKETRLLAIEWNTGRTGQITPVGLLEPVRFPASGVTVSRVTLHNLSRIKELGLSLGAMIKLKRSGDVIPTVVEVITPGNEEIQYPDSCPSCKNPTTIENDGNSDFVVCRYDECKGAIIRSVEYYCKTLSIDGFGPAIVEQLYDAQIVRNLGELYSAKFSSVVGDKTGIKLAGEVAKAKKLQLGKFIGALGIPLVGTSMAKKLEPILDAKKPSDILILADVLSTNIDRVEGAGEAVLESVKINLPKLTAILKLLDDHITLEKEEAIIGKLTGKSFVFTGTLQSMKRTEAQARVKSLGGETPSSVKKGVSYLVAGADESQSAKLQKAEKAGVTVLSEEEFLAML